MGMQKIGTSIKGKIIIAFFISAIALVGSFYIYKLTFKNIYESLADLSTPNKKLITVNSLFTEINESGKSFKNMMVSGKSFDDFIAHSNKMKACSDSLHILCKGNPYQLSLIDSISNLIIVRERFLLNYARYRQRISKNNPITKQIKLLDSMVAQNASNTDSLVLTHEQREVTTKTGPIPNDEVKEEKKTLWNKLFKPSKKKPETEQIQKIIQEVTSTKTDTIIFAKDSSYVGIQELINKIGEVQNERHNKFLSKETEFAEFNNSFDAKIHHLFSTIERDIIRQTASTLYKSESTINKSAQHIYFIILLFFLFFIIISFLILADITKSNKYKLLLEDAREDAELSSLSKQRFLANMSHEIRTPLQSIIGYTELIKDQDTPKKKHVEAIQSSSEHLLQIVNEILDYNRINSGKFTFEKSNFNMRQIIYEVISILKPQAEQKGIQLLYQQKDIEALVVYGDAFRLKQILLNLIGNAIKFTDEGSVRLEVTARAYARQLNFIFRIKDTGIGIPEEKQAHIFEQFEQVYSATDHPLTGTGLGLSITQALVEGQGGAITVESELGKGSCFTFNIYYDEAKATDDLNHTQELHTGTFHGSVCLVDDDPLILQLCSALLTKHHIAHTAFSSAEALLNNLPEKEPAMVLADIRLPGLNGFELCAILKKKYSDNLKIIALTAQALPEERAEILNQGFSDILLKPFREKDLMALFHIEVTQHNPVEELAGMFTDNKEERNQILQSYIQETEQDINLLKTAIVQTNKPDISLLLHKLAGRTAQIGAKELGMELRKLEIDFNNNQPNFDNMLIKNVLEQLKVLITQIKLKISS